MDNVFANNPAPQAPIPAAVEEKKAWWEKPFKNRFTFGAVCFCAYLLGSFLQIPFYFTAIAIAIWALMGTLAQARRKKRQQPPTDLPPIQS